MSQVRTNSIVPVGGIPAGASGGGIIQVVQTNLTAAQSQSTSTTYADITNMSVSITPRSSSSKVLLMWALSFCADTTNAEMAFRLVRSSTAISINTSSGTFVTQATWGVGDAATAVNTNWNTGNWSQSFVDSPATTSSTTYKIQFASGFMQAATTLYINRSAVTSSSEGVWSTSNFIAMEVSG